MLLLLACADPISLDGKDSPGHDSPTGTDTAGDTAPPDPGPFDAPVTGATATLHPSIPAIFYVHWTQAQAADSVRVEYRLDGAWLATPDQDGSLGDHTQIVLGVPYATEAPWRIVATRGDTSLTTDGAPITTGAAPDHLPTVTLDHLDPSAWDPADRFLLTSVSEENPMKNLHPHFWVVLVDRQGRYVWAYPANTSAWTLFVKPARDGAALLYDDSLYWSGFDGGMDSQVHRLLLDGTVEHDWDTPHLAHAFDDLDADTIAWSASEDGDEVLTRVDGAGKTTALWSCLDWVTTSDVARSPDHPDREMCGTNALSWNEDTDTWIISLWSHETVLEVDTDRNEVLWYADPTEGHGAEVDPDAIWRWQHEATLIEGDHLLLSSGVEDDPPNADGSFAATAAYEYALDRDAGTLTLVWSYVSEPDWASRYKGGARRLSAGDTLHWYGDVGGVKEITPAGDVVWQARFERPDASWIGRSTWLDDLYAFAPAASSP